MTKPPLFQGSGWIVGASLGVLLLGCATPPPVPPILPPPPLVDITPAISPYAFSRVFTAEAGVEIRSDSSVTATVPRAFVSLNVLGRDSLGLVVRCQSCDPPADGRVKEDEIVHTAEAPGVAALGSLGEFALAISIAAGERNMEALSAVMAPDFFFSFVGSQTPEAAIAVWQSEDYASLDQVPALLEEGLGTIDGKIWAAPREYVESLGYQGLRLGFRKKADGSWEWLYLIRGVTG